MSVQQRGRVVEARHELRVGVGIESRNELMIFFVEHSPVVSLCAKKTELYNTTNEK